MVNLYYPGVRHTEPEHAHCNNCGGPRNHEILHVERTVWDDGDRMGVSGSDAYYTLRCKGCRRIHLRHDSWFSEHQEDDGTLIPTVTYYPPATARRRPDWLTAVWSPFSTERDVVPSLLGEIYTSLQNGSRRLAAMGIRALLEHVMIEKAGDHGSFEKNITAFFDAGYIAPIDQHTFRDKLIEAGHAAMHR